MTIKQLENTISKIAGISVEITIISEKKFSFMYEGESAQAEQAIKKYFLGQGTFSDEPVFDEECDASCLFLEIK